MKPNSAEQSIFQTNRKRRNLQILCNMESGNRNPWGLSDQKKSNQPTINVDLLYNLADNIKKFQIRRRVRKGSSFESKRKQASEKSQKETNQDKQENFGDLIKSYKRRIQMLVTNEKNQIYSTQMHSARELNRQQFENRSDNILTQQKTQRINNVQVKFLPNRGNKSSHKKSPSLGEPLGQKFMNQIKLKMLSRRNHSRIDSQRSQRQISEKQLKENTIRRHQQMPDPSININKIIPSSVRDKHKHLKIFDLELLQKMNSGLRLGGEFSQVDLTENKGNRRRVRPIRALGCFSQRTSYQFLMPR